MNPFEKWLVWVTSALSGFTGVGYFWTKYLVQNTDPFSVLNHPLQPWFLKAHIIISPFLLIALGSILVRHIWKHFRLGAVLGRRSGLTTALVSLPMVVSGYFIQSVTHPGLLATLAVSHIVLSALYLVGLSVHQVVVHLRQGRDGTS
jgi:uncharacterized membrane protein YhdT